jgi:hypothetical protein
MEITKPQHVFRTNYTIPPTTMGTPHVLSSVVDTNPTLATWVERTCIWKCPLSTNKFPTYQQYPSNISQLLPGFNPSALLPPPQLQKPLALPMNPNIHQPMQVAPIQNPPRPTPIPAQPIPNPNNRPTQTIQNIEV